MSKTFGEEISKKLAETMPNDYISKTSKYIPVFILGAIASTLLTWLKNGAEEEPEDMAILETDLTNKSSVVKIPDFIKVIKNITEDIEYRNSNIFEQINNKKIILTK
jgi:hypothetical protein